MTFLSSFYLLGFGPIYCLCCTWKKELTGSGREAKLGIKGELKTMGEQQILRIFVLLDDSGRSFIFVVVFSPG